MSYLLPHLHSGWAVDQAILAEEERLVVIRFGHDWDETCMQVMLCLLQIFPSLLLFSIFLGILMQAYILTKQTLLIAILMFLHGNLVVFACGIKIRVVNLEAWLAWVS